MRLPRDLSGSDLAQFLRKLGYVITRQTGSHIRLTSTASIISRFLCILRFVFGTLSAILADVSTHFKLTREQQLDKLFA